MTRARARATLAASCVTHFLHDGFSDIVYVLLPVWAGEFRLTFAQVGLLRTAYSGGMASFQVPAGILAERWGERGLLAAGTAGRAFGLLVLGLRGGLGIRDRKGFQSLSAVHVIDNTTRTAFLPLLPFLLIAKGSTVQAVGLALALGFACGDAGGG